MGKRSAPRSRKHLREHSRVSWATLMKTWCPLTLLVTTDHQYLMLKLAFSSQRHLLSWSHGMTMRWDTPTESSTSSHTCRPKINSNTSITSIQQTKNIFSFCVPLYIMPLDH